MGSRYFRQARKVKQADYRKPKGSYDPDCKMSKSDNCIPQKNRGLCPMQVDTSGPRKS